MTNQYVKGGRKNRGGWHKEAVTEEIWQVVAELFHKFDEYALNCDIYIATSNICLMELDVY